MARCSCVGPLLSYSCVVVSLSSSKLSLEYWPLSYLKKKKIFFYKTLFGKKIKKRVNQTGGL